MQRLPSQQVLLSLLVLCSQLLSLNYSIRLFYSPAWAVRVLHNLFAVSRRSTGVKCWDRFSVCWCDMVLTQALCDLLVGFVCLALLLAMLVVAFDHLAMNWFAV